MKFLCVHCHYYQPPRENPWLEQIETQDSAYPFHDWNERVTSECYARNSAARILDSRNRIQRIVNLYSTISFNFGPTLLSWLEEKARFTYEAILRADSESIQRFGGHGSAIAQCYNHVIMPLASARDKRTQIRWGIADFVSRFGRRPEGMWLPETAVDTVTLSMLVDEGIRFTILAPLQAQYSRAAADQSWIDVTGGRIDPKRPYRANTPSGPISLFFYDGPVSRAVAFEGLLDDGVKFAERLMEGFASGDDAPQLMHIATDGETYGHHHKFGEMALAYALNYIESKSLATLTNYGQFLEANPPLHEVEIIENTAWSCAHGVGRWSTDCGCNAGGGPGWNQRWRAPLRAALDWLRDTLAPLTEEKASGLFQDFWAARDGYIDVVLDRSLAKRREFLGRYLSPPPSPEAAVGVWKLLELQRHLMLMYTSCGWFFDDISGIETVQVIEYAARAVQLAEELFSQLFEEDFLSRLSLAKSNIAEEEDGALIYHKRVRPAMADLMKVGAHYAVSSMFEPYPEKVSIYCYDILREELKEASSGRIRLAIGKARITSQITLESKRIQYAVLHFGDQNIHARIGKAGLPKSFEQITNRLLAAFERSDWGSIIRMTDRGFPSEVSLSSLFKDAQRKTAAQIVRPATKEIAAANRRLYREHSSLLRLLHSLQVPPPSALRDALAHALDDMLNDALSVLPLDEARIRDLVHQAQTAGVKLDGAALERTLQQALKPLADQFFEDDGNLKILTDLARAAEFVQTLPVPVRFWTLQTRCYRLWEAMPESRKSDSTWLDAFRRLCTALNLRTDAH
ncbi:MAG TPA: DUF3536 domain-containing protein [Bryobacteraceae bacterium]|jgi:alpha-amylase/alpha-mannosidase (GH57 family)|nr:DUF3536 domain-containing protein [Bryobacteraceae bacterium]